MISNAGGGSEDGEIPDAYDRSFSDEWLPSWKLLQASLISEYRIKMKAIEEKAEEKAGKKITCCSRGIQSSDLLCLWGATQEG